VMITKHLILVLSALCLSVRPSDAYSLSLGGKGGTLGVGMESTYLMSDLVCVIASVNGLKLDAGLSSKKLGFDGNLRLLTAGASVGIHPFRNGFRVLGGLFYGGNQFNLSAQLTQTVTLNGQSFTPDQVGSVKTLIHFNRVSPYLGIGFDSVFCQSGPWFLFAEGGILFQGSPKAKTKSSNAHPLIKDYIKRESKKSADKPLLTYYPVASVGIKYIF
jgi:hypothetical protein